MTIVDINTMTAITNYDVVKVVPVQGDKGNLCVYNLANENATVLATYPLARAFEVWNEIITGLQNGEKCFHLPNE